MKRIFSTNKSGAGFTLIEILVALGILALIFSLGLFLSMGFYRGYAFNYELNLAASLLQAVRSQAMSNINQAPHGVHFADGKYIIFQGSSYNAADPSNYEVPANQAVEISGGPDIIFEQLSGQVLLPGDIIISQGGKTAAISVNSEGGINW